MPGVQTPALGLPYPSLQTPPNPATKILIINGASSSVGNTTTQLATAAGITILAICGAQNFSLAKEAGASRVFDRNSPSLVTDIVAAVRAIALDFIGIVDAISTPENYSVDLSILRALGGGHLACSHPPPTEGVPSSVKTGMIFAVNDIVAPVFRDFVTPALEGGVLKCLPTPTVVGNGLEFVDGALKMSKAGVRATKLVVEL
jgi:NADPH:quinone reductase-like Zn-dependent oxidoreductase